jgi:hypothetical protein
MMPGREKSEPASFGLQPDGTYAPDPIEIEQRCAEIREQWSIEERNRRIVWKRRGRAICAPISIEQFGE